MQKDTKNLRMRIDKRKNMLYYILAETQERRANAMFNKQKFKASMMAVGKTSKETAEALGINEATLYRKISRDGDFSRAEIQKLTEFLKLENPIEIFFESLLA